MRAKSARDRGACAHSGGGGTTRAAIDAAFGTDLTAGLRGEDSHWRAPARFGHLPPLDLPLGYDGNHYRSHWPCIDLPMQTVSADASAETGLEPNTLIWGDNLHVLRTLADDSVDLVYMDPPFFSNRNYSVIWNDANEVRSFEDTWDGGLPGYLIWLNARLWEMRRVLKPEGSIYVHCDWHASHYIKVEMDRIFGPENFRNEIIWAYTGPGTSAARQFNRKHDTIFWYSRGKQWAFNADAVRVPYKHGGPRTGGFTERGGRRMDAAMIAERYSAGKVPETWWSDCTPVGRIASERVGYPTQKPEALLERIVKASSNEGDVILDPFVGGGTAAVVAQRLNRRWIAIDQSRMAVSVTEQRLRASERQGELGEVRQRGFEVRYWGVYEAGVLSAMEPDAFRRFVVECYGAQAETNGGAIHGWRRGEGSREPVWAGHPSPRSTVSPGDVTAFARAIREHGGNGSLGVMLAWGFGRRAEQAAREIAEREDLGIEFVKVRQLPLGSEEFRAHVRAKTDAPGSYGRLLTFVHAPAVRVAHERRGSRTVAFDASETRVTNPGARIVSVQWDFGYNGRAFKADPRHWYRKGQDLPLRIEHEFGQAGVTQVACRVQDDMGGEGMAVIDVNVEA